MGQVLSFSGHHAHVRHPGAGGCPPLNALDLDHLERQSLGDRDLAVELLGLFDCQAAQTLARLMEQGQTVQARSDLAHTLKGSALAVGAMAVAEAAEHYEDALANPPHKSSAELAAVGAAIAGARAAIATLIGPRCG